ncbi:hypothetical protein [Kitasatospora sp. CB02891]|uniref:hypothetical protein n=1 Tax=Kitasatospora sp. CB02891 TaxID=2020329 RepID=UPI000C27B1FB|nr:hypothetical protein [Kitasatospora sp. CB02891]PJN21031.1 hypothetical protein CG736_35530 [Kitasatospora sp. CB02891]
MADETVWVDLDEVEAAAKKIMDLLHELEGPANHLEAVVKQVEDSVYGTDLVGKALKGGGSSVGGLSKHQQQALQGIRELMKNATAVGQNLQAMASRHRANDELHSTEIGRIATNGDLPAAPRLSGVVDAVPASLPSAPRVPAADPVPTPPPPAPVAPIGDTGVGDGYHGPDAPTLDYNHHKDIPDPIRGGGGPGTRQVI